MLEKIKNVKNEEEKEIIEKAIEIGLEALKQLNRINYKRR